MNCDKFRFFYLEISSLYYFYIYLNTYSKNFIVAVVYKDLYIR